MSHPLSEEMRQQWKEKILKQKESGLSVTNWCYKNNTTIHSYYYWKQKLFPKQSLDRSAFTEVPNKTKCKSSDLKSAGIALEHQGMLIHLEKHFDTLTLKQCLDVLMGAKC